MAERVFHGPDPATRPAGFRPPAGACNSHAHIYGPAARFPYPGNPKIPPRPDATFEDYAKTHEVLGIERGVLIQSSRYGTDNRALLDALEQGGTNFRGIAAMHAGDLTDSAIAGLDARGVRGIRIHKEEFSEIEAVSDRIAQAGWRIEIVPEDIASFVALRPRLEKLKCHVLVDQMAKPDASRPVEQPMFQQVLSMVREGFLWIKLSHVYVVSKAGPPYADVLPFAQALVAANPTRCLWGTDWPHNTKWEVPNDGFLLDLLADWVPDEGTRNRILVDNPSRLNGF